MRGRAEYPNHVWTYDFVADQTADGRLLRILAIVDEFTRESVALEVERSMGAREVIDVLKAAIQNRGTPQRLRSDNGSEFIASRGDEMAIRLLSGSGDGSLMATTE